MNSDLINALFATLGAMLVLNHCRVIIKDRCVKGVSVFSTAMFTLWGIFQLYYYPSLGQWYSFVASFLMVVANIVYFVLMMRFRSPNAGPK